MVSQIQTSRDRLESEKPPEETVREILAHGKDAYKLADHPWAHSLLVADFKSRTGKDGNNSGYLLLEALAELFKGMLPSTPPRRGKRLDTSWGQFGMLAAMYFAEIEFSFPAASSLRDAWGKIDNVISLYIRQKYGEDIAQAEEEKYYLLSNEREITPTSTLSDWHARGLERFSKMLYAKERRLSSNSGHPSPVLDESITTSGGEQPIPRRGFLPWIAQRAGKVRRVAGRLVLGLLAIGLLYLGWVGQDSYTLARQLYTQAEVLKSELAAGIDLQRAEELSQAGQSVVEFRQTAESLANRSASLVWFTDRLAWLPFIGRDLAVIHPFLEMTELTAISAEQLYGGVSPILASLAAESGSTSINEISGFLQASAPQFRAAALATQRAAELRQGMNLEGVHSLLSDAILNDFDPAFEVLSDSASLMAALPPLLGMDGEPANYLVLLQNEDELRATGGFITAVGGLVLQDGTILSFNLENSYDVDDYDYLYPAPPWQLEEFMDAPILVLRDANWRPDFPVVAEQVETLYAYSRAHTVDGVIALDQHALQVLVGALGSVSVDGQIITSENVLAYMQAERGAVPNPGESTPENSQWLRDHRKDFMRPMAEAILERLRSGSDVPWQGIIEALSQALTEKHILFQFDEPTVAAFLAQNNWDGQLRYSGGDYLMLVDANVGFTKSNAIITTENTYKVDLTDLHNPVAALSVTYANHSSVIRDCDPRPGIPRVDAGDYEGLINDCHWTYLRVYKSDETRVTDYRTQSVPSEWVLSGEAVPARVDYLDEIEGFAEFGTLVVIPTQQSQTVAMAFDLPGTVVEQNGDTYTYRLTIQKQPGVKQLDLNLGITLPPGAQLVSISNPDLLHSGNEVSGELVLATDTVIELVFALP